MGSKMAIVLFWGMLWNNDGNGRGGFTGDEDGICWPRFESRDPGAATSFPMTPLKTMLQEQRMSTSIMAFFATTIGY